jgi:hypothetical protein
VFAESVRTYSKRLLSPFRGLVQIAEAGDARALTLDGRHWAIQCARAGRARLHGPSPDADPDQRFALVATVEEGELKTRALHPFLDPHAVEAAVEGLFATVASARVPFAATDCYEYWLLDAADGAPLALLDARAGDEEALPPPRPSWIAMPAAQLEVQAPEADPTHYVPPVNYRLQKLVEARAGPKPQARWFHRAAPAGFPPCLIREDWASEEAQQLCGRYLDRLAPRLLMLHGLPRAERQRLERAARKHVFDVERFYTLYPEVVDEKLITAARVEAQLRRTAGAGAS